MVEVGVGHVLSDFFLLDLVPDRVTGDAALVSDPADAGWLGGEDGDVPFGFLDIVKPFIKSVGHALGTATTCTIHPYFDKLALVAVRWVAQDFLELVEVILIVFRLGGHLIFR